MLRKLGRIFDDRPADMRVKLAAIYAVLLAANVLSWLWALYAFRPYPVLLGTAFLAYAFGLRHAVDADHIAAIDNVTRKLMQAGKRPVSVGLFFALGHSTVVILATAAIAATATQLASHFDAFRHVGSVVGALISTLFLFLIAAMNIAVLIAVWRTFRH